MATADSGTISNWGEIWEMSLPAGWREVQDDALAADGRLIRRFVPPAGEARLCLEYRRPVSAATGVAFLSILMEDFHELPADELAALGEILEDIARPEAFQLAAAGTGYLGRKCVLRVLGLWLNDGWDALTIFTNADEEGCVVQSVSFAAGPDDFERLLPEAVEAIDSIVWK